jgi:ElaB/YqjD/DUF883 family membrane-anchored ribosome-binding protein
MSADYTTDDTKTPGNSATSVSESATKLTAEAQRSFNEAAKRVEKAVADGLEQIRAQSRTYADNAGQHLDEAQRYVVERVKEKPLMAAGTALGVGVLIGLLLASGRNR